MPYVNTPEQRIFRAQAAARLEMLRRMQRELVDDRTRLDRVLEDLNIRHCRLSLEIQQEERQWKEDQ